ncbi:alpha-amylase family glycosyl hydrolase [Actinoplanes oblitus]|uniref:Alpha-amylase family glycosyl hydrolase n=1 Tax=Actinoplanes oblitus TaxID=3040509 RepID=A0ABY8WPL4_9ACTN|nr:alpha-amylase family glycosyl hydrolase [Actinoplanes oblitus]WIM98956.1 alpha-amylase family glycosyl hydrolase [Actinoplanes oblitus]
MADRSWWRDGVVYQVYPRSFADASGDGVGDLPGLTAGLGRLAGLGVDAIWLTPFQPSPQADHGYDVSDYTGVDPLFGDLAAFDAMLSEAHRLGLRVLIDIVPNHCSVEHPVFRAALAGDPSARARFHFAAEPNNWPSVFGGPAWSRTPDGAHYLHLYAPEQPDWNWREPRTAPYFDEVLRFWFDRGVDGLRVDVAHGLFKAPGLPPLPPGSTPEPGRLRGNPLACDQPEVIDVYRRWRAIADNYRPPRVLIGEVNLEPERAARYVGPDRLHQAFAFGFLTAAWDAEAWRAAGERQLRHRPVTWVVENHDVVRAPTRYGNPARARAALLTILGLPGAAYLYQGQEYGLPQVDVPPEARQDPAWRRSGMCRDGCRVPLPGFASPGGAPPWLPVPPGWESHLRSPSLPLCRRAIELRRRLVTGDDQVDWSIGRDARLVVRGPLLTLVVAMGSGPVPLPPGELLLASDPLTGDGRLPADAAAWLRSEP